MAASTDFSSAASGGVANGVYGIGGLTPNTAGFQIRIALGQASLGGRTPTVTDADGSANGDSRDSDGAAAGGNDVLTFSTGAAGANVHTYDFGFASPLLALGNFVWFDTNDDGAVTAGELPVTGGVDLTLFRDNGNGVFDANTDTAVATQTTGSAGQYLFTGLTPGNYFVRIPASEFGAGQPLAGFLSSTGQQTGDAANNRDHGAPAPMAGQGLVSELVTLTIGGEPIDDGDVDPNTNLTIDFGFHRPPPDSVSLGNYVWVDANNDGVVSPGESGINGVTVRLLNGSGTAVLATQLTSGGGFYLFSDLVPGDYVVEVVTPIGFISSTGGGTEPASDPDNDRDNDDNGTTAGTVVRSLPVTLTVGGEPTNDGDVDPNSNLTVDFGFFSPTDDPCLEQTVPTVATPGGQLFLSYSAINRGPGVSTNVAIEGMIPALTSFVSATPTAGGACAVVNGMLTCTWLGATPVGLRRSVEVVLRVSSTAPHGSIIPLWFMTQGATMGTSACSMVDAYVFVSNGTSPTADLVVSASATGGGQFGAAVAVPVNQPIQARVAVTNTGAVAAQGQYSLILDEVGALDVTNTSVTQGWVASSGLSSGVFDTGMIPPGGTAALTLTLVPRTTAAAKILIVRVSGSPADPNATNDQHVFDCRWPWPKGHQVRRRGQRRRRPRWRAHQRGWRRRHAPSACLHWRWRRDQVAVLRLRSSLPRRRGDRHLRRQRRRRRRTHCRAGSRRRSRAGAQSDRWRRDRVGRVQRVRAGVHRRRQRRVRGYEWGWARRGRRGARRRSCSRRQGLLRRRGNGRPDRAVLGVRGWFHWRCARGGRSVLWVVRRGELPDRHDARSGPSGRRAPLARERRLRDAHGSGAAPGHNHRIDGDAR